MTVTRSAVLGVALATVLVAAGCGGASSASNGRGTRTAPPARQVAAGPKAPPPGNFLAVDARRHTVTITLIAAYDGVNSGFNFDGYSRYLMWTVPRRWTVDVVCKNRGPLRHSCAVVRGPDTSTLAFHGASTPQPLMGIEEGTTVRFSFRASKVGTYRFVCLVPGHEDARMWDVLQITPHGKPSAVDLRAKS